VPQRTCVVCRRVAGKRELIRIVRTSDGIQVDPTGKLPGRGAYLHPEWSCWEVALEKNLLARALRTQISLEEQESLREFGLALFQDAGVETDGG
jgi:uncharacterized protein